MKFDRTTCVTAGELRQANWDIDARIPDVAWIPLSSIDFEVQIDQDSKPGVMSARVVFRSTEPFRWVSVVIDVTDMMPEDRRELCGELNHG